MGLVYIAEDLAINIDKIILVKVVEDTDKYFEPHVLIDFGSTYLELSPEISMEHVCSVIEQARRESE